MSFVHITQRCVLACDCLCPFPLGKGGETSILSQPATDEGYGAVGTVGSALWDQASDAIRTYVADVTASAPACATCSSTATAAVLATIGVTRLRKCDVCACLQCADCMPFSHGFAKRSVVVEMAHLLGAAESPRPAAATSCRVTETFLCMRCVPKLLGNSRARTWPLPSPPCCSTHSQDMRHTRGFRPALAQLLAKYATIAYRPGAAFLRRVKSKWLLVLAGTPVLI